jgi:hypothetical protein
MGFVSLRSREWGTRVQADLDDIILEELHTKYVDHRKLLCHFERLDRSRHWHLPQKLPLQYHRHYHHHHAHTGPHQSTNMSNNTGEGRREDALVKQRNQAREEYERQKQQLINETEKARPSAHRFVGQNDSMEDSLKNSTVGLVRLEDFQQKRKELEEAKAREAARTDELK